MIIGAVWWCSPAGILGGFTMRRMLVTVFVGTFWSVTSYCAAEPAASGEAAAVVAQAVKAVGGETKLLKLLKIKEELVLGADPAGKKSVRVSVLEPPKDRKSVV